MHGNMNVKKYKLDQDVSWQNVPECHIWNTLYITTFIRQPAIFCVFKMRWGFWNGRKISEIDPKGSDGDLILGILAFSLGTVAKDIWVIMLSLQADLDMTSPANETTLGASLLLLLAAGNRIRGGSNDLIPTSLLMKIGRLLMEIKRFSLWNIKQHSIWKVIHYLSYVSRYCQKYVQKTCLFQQSRDLFLFSPS